MNSLLQHLDALYSQNKLEEAHQYLLEQTQLAMQMQDDILVLVLLSELIGLYRVTARFEEGHKIAMQAMRILEVKDLVNTIHGATTYLNIATLYRVQGKYQEALSLFEKTETIYQKLLDENDERYCGFYNNYSLLYQAMGNYQKALEYELKALDKISQLENCEMEQAITYTNLSQIYFSMNDIDQAEKSLYQSIALFEKYNPKDPHYFAALSALAQSYYLKKEYDKAIDLYDEVLKGIESVFGKNKDYQTVLVNKQKVEEEKANQKLKGLELCQKYYEAYGQKMIDEQFSEYRQYMAVGLFGFGSDCLGYDDAISQDHDFGPGFCIWLPRDIYQKIGSQLQVAYDLLPSQFMGYQRKTSRQGQGRVGVFVIEDFFNQFLYRIPHTLEQWLYVDENALLACTNGRIFVDNYGEVTRIRQSLAYYPEDIRIKKIARAIAKMAQSGQYNYARCMQRHDEVAASLALHEFVNETLSVVYLLNKKYKPYYKWSYYGLKDCMILKDVQEMILELIQLGSQLDVWNQECYGIHYNDQKVVLIEKICQRVIYELKHQGLSMSDDDFLDNHTIEVMSHIQDEKIRLKHVMEG